MDMELAGLRAVVTGASRGIGLAVARALIAEGAEVIGAARGATDESAALESEGGFTFVAADLGSAAGVEAFADVVAGDVDVLVNNVGSAPPRPGGFASITDDDWQRTLELNLLACVRVTRSFLPQLTPGAAIVNIASENSLLPDPLVMDYSAAKAGVLSFTKSLAKQAAAQGLRVNAISPGPVATDLWLGGNGVAAVVSGATGQSADDVRRGAEAAMPTGRFTRPEEVADLVVVLASPRFANVSGAEFVIDGGMRPTI